MIYARLQFDGGNKRFRQPSQLGLQNTPTASRLRSKIPLNECPGYDIKQSDGEAPVMLALWGIWSTTSVASLQGSL